MRRTLGVVLTVLGLLLIVGAVVVRTVVAPAMAKLPGDQTTTRMYAGQAASIINPTYATDVPSGPGILHNVPVTVRHTDKVIDSTATRALVADQRVVTIPEGVAANLNYRYVVDRKTFQPASNSGFSNVMAARGLTFNWPMNTKPHDYVGWVQDTLTTTPLHYVAAVRHGGIRTYEFTAQAGDKVITDPVLSAVLPAKMSKADMLKLTPSLGLSMKQLLALNKVLAGVPDPVPLAYTYRFAATFWIAPDSGIIVDMKQQEARTTNIVTSSGVLVPTSPIMDMSYAFTTATVKGAVNDANKAVDQLRLIRTVLPATALIGGIVLLVVGIVLLTVPRRRQPEVPEGPFVEELLEPREPVLH